MGKMRILSKKTFALGEGARRDGKFVPQLITVRGAIQEIDESYKDDATFKMAVAGGEIIIMNEDISTDKQLEILERKPEKAKEKEPTKLDLFKEKVKLMDASEVEEAAKEYGATFDKDAKLRENKKRLVEAYKLSIVE